MSLILPAGPSWRHYSDNLSTGSPNATTIGTAITPGTGVKGNTASLLSALAHDVEYLRVGTPGWAVSGVNGSALIDIMYDPAGGTNWQVLIPNLLGSYTGGSSPATSFPACVSRWYDFPIWIPAGSTVGARAQRASGTIQGRVLLQTAGGNRNPASWWCGQAVTAIAITEASTIGQAHTPSNTGWSDWANLGSPLATDCGAVQFSAGGPNSSAAIDSGYIWQFGIGGDCVGPTIQQALNTSEATWLLPTGPLFASLPAGAQLQVRGRTDAGTPPSIDVAAWVVS